MRLEQVDITIGTDGKIHIETSGFSGSSCLDATEDLEALLGNLILEREQTAEASERTAGQTAEKIKIRC